MVGGVNAKLRFTALSMGAALAVVLFALPVMAGGIGEDWHFYKPVELPANLSGTGLVELELDREVFAHASASLGDLRVTEHPEGREIPYKMLVESGDHRRAAVAVAMRDLGHVDGEYTSFILDLKSGGALHNEVEVKTSSDNFQRRVEIEGSDDGEAWRKLVRDATIFGLTIRERGFTTSETRVRYPASTARFLRVRIIDNGEEPLTIRGGVVFFSQQLEPQRNGLPLVITGRDEVPQKKQTVLVLDAGCAGFPANRIDLKISQRNFYRQVVLEGSDNNLDWYAVQRDETVFDFDTPKFVGNDLTVGFRESRYRYYRLTIQNEDNPPLPVEGARVSGFLRKLIFSAEADKEYRLYYGHPDAPAPSYELERIFPYLVTENLPVARLGVHKQNPAFTLPESPPLPFTERYPWLLPTIVAVAALLVGAFLTSLVRQVGGRLRPPEAGE